MRIVWVGVVRSAIVFMVGTTLAAGLIATPAFPSQAVVTHAVTRPGVPGRVPAVLARAAVARLMAARVGLRGSGGLIPSAGETSLSQVGADARTGMLTGVVRSGTGRPFAGACVRAAGPAGDTSAVTRADGRYLLTGLRPGRYRLRAGVCGTALRAPGGLPVISLWRHLPATVTVRAGQLATLPSATVRDPGQLRLAPRRIAGLARPRTGSISGLVTGNGRPLAGICVNALPTGGGQVGGTITSKTGRYRISQLAPGS